VALSSVCDAPVANVLFDTLSDDDRAAAVLATTLPALCSPPTTVRSWPTADAGVLFDVSTGQPWAHGGAMFGVMGGPFGQKLVNYLERTAAADVRFNSTATDNLFVRQNGVVILQAPFAQSNATHDWFLLELVKQPSRGAPALVGYGFGGPGTIAAQYYLQTQVLPARSNFTKSWYVVEWRDDGDGGVGAGDTFTPVASGP
jgi:hypothetical protein